MNFFLDNYRFPEGPLIFNKFIGILLLLSPLIYLFAITRIPASFVIFYCLFTLPPCYHPRILRQWKSTPFDQIPNSAPQKQLFYFFCLLVLLAFLFVLKDLFYLLFSS